MNFTTISQAIVTTLGDAAAGRYRVIGYQRQGQSAEETRNNNRTVQVFYSQGDFPKNSGRRSGSTQHNMAFSIGLTVSAASRINLTVINNPDATAGQISTALAAMQDASAVADTLWDELAAIVYQVLMDARNIDLGLAIGTMSDRWITTINKDMPNPQGALVVLTGVVQYTCNTVEAITGDTGTAAESPGGVYTQIGTTGDAVSKTGVSV